MVFMGRIMYDESIKIITTDIFQCKKAPVFINKGFLIN